MTLRWPSARAHQTRFIVVDTKLCAACASCVDACRRKVLGQVKFLWHRHARVDHPDACTGCRRCVTACVHGAITATTQTPEKRAS
jgi:NAD-dependent dihydropyrimidine dehydrogenase PreA subunit